MTRPANGRAHLSIGEVLSLLQDEFPDVTISKIRFLESQGLLDPERTPSGYRKFYDEDIERLRWILRQQKDHYLPLKVIKDRLDAGEHISLTSNGHSEGGQGALPLGRAAVAVSERVDTRPVDTSQGQTPQRQDTSQGQTPQRQDTSQGQTPQRQAAARSAASAAPGAPAHAPASARAPAQQRQQQAAPPARQTEAPARQAARAPAPAAPAARQPQPRQQPQPRSRPQTPASAPAPAAPAVVAPVAQPTGAVPAAGAASVSLSIEELAEASGLSVRDVRDLERFGLIEARESGGSGPYDGDALVVAQTAAGFLQHGIEARHMRTYKVAIDREAGLFEQIVSPVLKQRNPEARTRAARTVTELIRLGEVMRGVLLRRELRDLLGGSGH